MNKFGLTDISAYASDDLDGDYKNLAEQLDKILDSSAEKGEFGKVQIQMNYDLEEPMFWITIAHLSKSDYFKDIDPKTLLNMTIESKDDLIALKNYIDAGIKCFEQQEKGYG